jgi:hypothetical protein
VFFDPDVQGGAQGAEQAARRQLAALKARRAGFNDAPAYGDRFAFMQNYVERTADYIGSHFGPGFAAAIAQLPVGDTWRGPVQSMHGWHLVMLTAHAPGRLPALDDIRALVLDDYQRERAAALKEAALRSLVDGYEVQLRDLGAAE